MRRCGGIFPTVVGGQAEDVEEAAVDGEAVAFERAAQDRNGYAVHRLLRGLSRADVRWGPRFCSTAPCRIPRPLLHQISLWARHSVGTRAEPTRDGCGGAAEFFQWSWGGQVEDVEARSTEKRWPSSERRRIGIGTPYTDRYAG